MQIFDHSFRPHLDFLLNCNFTGTCFQKLSLKDQQSSTPSVFCKDPIYDHFKVTIPYAGFVLVWEVLFDSTCPEQAPDFLFDDDSFTSFLTVDILSQRVPSLSNWNVSNPECLSQVLQELLNLYTVHQLQRLEKDGSSLGVECSKLMQEFELDARQLQVLSGDSPILNHNYYGGSTRPPHGTVSMMFLNLEEQLAIENIPKRFRQIALQFGIREYNPSTVVLHLNPGLRYLLGQQSDLEIPNYSKSDGLPSYFRHFFKIVHETLSQVTQNYDRREEFHLNMLQNLTTLNDVSVKPLESDMPHFTSSTYMIEINDYPIIVIIRTPSYSLGDPKVFLKTLTGQSKEVSVSSSWDVQKVTQAILDSVMSLFEEDSDSSS